MNKIFDYLYLLLFCAIILLPSATLLVRGSILKSSSESIRLENENRKLSQWPAIVGFKGGLKSYARQINSFIEDRVIFRAESINFITKLRFHMFNLESDNDGIFGQDGWLFLELGVSNAIGKINAQLGDEHFESWSKSALEIKKRVEKNGGIFMVMVPPDKPQVYPEYLGKQFRHAPDQRVLERLKPWLLANDILIVDLLETIKVNKEKYPLPLYSKTDTHWTHEGAFIGYQEVISQLNSHDVKVESVDVSSFSKRVHSNFIGDIAGILGLQSEYSEPLNVLNPQDSFKKLSPSKTLLVYGDSFSGRLNNFWPYSFKSVQCFHHNVGKPNIGLIDKVEADVVILQIVERNLIAPMVLDGSGSRPCV